MPVRIGGVKVPGLNWSGSDKPGYVARAFNTTAEQGIKGKAAAWFNDHKQNGVAIAEKDRLSYTSSRSSARKQASAEIAKIPFDLANHIARVYRP